ncbi:MAG TPA: thiol reductant ABC exporter subunit CydD [Streptosporangiaceae bacterium]|nr:thiol reductant ABC exporter subunit CydD [Streptosporangiaceae bacterium]
MRPVDPRLLRQGRAARGYLAVTVGLGLTGTVLILLQAGLLATALAGAARGIGIGALAGTLAWLGVVLAGRAAAAAGGEAAALRAAAEVKSGLRRRLSAHALRLGPAWLGGQRAGEIAALATKGLDGLDAYFARYLPQLMLAVVVPLAVLVRIAFADWISAVIIAATLPLIPLFGVLIGWHTRAQTQRQWRLLALLGGHFLDVVSGLPTLKLFGRAKAQAEVIEEVTSAHRKATMTTLRVAFLSALALELTAALATALVAVEIGLRLLYGHVSYQTALLVLLLTPEAYLPLRNVSAQFHASTEGTTAARRAFEILDTPLPARRGVPGGKLGSSPRGQHSSTAPAAAGADVDLIREDIALQAVTLSYPGRERPALDEVSLTIRPREQIILTGPNGAGKSSLLALLLRFAAPTSGSIAAGPVDLAAIPADRWRSQIAWVPQHPHVFTATVAENIALGQPGAGREDIVAAARLAGADDFIRRLPRGYDTVLTEGARTLSAGQRQKLALARAFLRRAPVLLLDEPTAHLDPVSADRVNAAIGDQMAGRTVILVTHRPPPWAGRIGGPVRVLALDHGRLTGVDDPVERAGLAAAP